MENIKIRDDIEMHMKELKDWLEEIKDCPPEEMAAFFTARLEGYEEHMAIWKPAYERFARLLPETCREILDLGCGTGLELDEIWKLRGDVNVTGVDLNEEMLEVLAKKQEARTGGAGQPMEGEQGVLPVGIGSLTLVCRSYFDYDMGTDRWDAVISFESLHHFFPEEKLGLYRNICRGLRPGGIFLLGDYIACCDEEERILQEMYLEKHRRFAVPEGQFIHIDIPLTCAHEKEVLRRAGFDEVAAVDSINGATILIAKKGEK